MTSRRPPSPTDAELNILRVLWSRGPSSVRDVYDVLYTGTDVGYTTALKLLQNMHEKGLVTRDARQRQHVYAAAVPEEQTLRTVVRRLIDKTFGGSATALAMHALGAKPATQAELTELKHLIQQLEREEQVDRAETGRERHGKGGRR